MIFIYFLWNMNIKLHHFLLFVLLTREEDPLQWHAGESFFPQWGFCGSVKPFPAEPRWWFSWARRLSSTSCQPSSPRLCPPLCGFLRQSHAVGEAPIATAHMKTSLTAESSHKSESRLTFFILLDLNFDFTLEYCLLLCTVHWGKKGLFFLGYFYLVDL